MASLEPPDPQLGIGEEAARWLCELREGDREQQAAFFAWLRRSPRHVEEFLFATTVWKKLHGFGQNNPERVERLIAAAAAVDAGNVVPLQQSLDSRPAGSATRHRRLQPAVAISAAAALTIVGLAATLWFTAFGAPTYGTEVGEQRIVRLQDGSRVDMNTRTRIAVQFSEKGREIRLLEGEALFTVARDSQRPFRVIAGGAIIQALGTQFNVYRHQDGTRVSVVEGIVRVAKSAELTAGEEAQVSLDGRVARQSAPDVAKAVAWRERRLIFRADRLEEVAAEVNRYSLHPIHVTDDKARDLRLTAIFDADDPESLVRFLSRMDTLKVERGRNGTVVGTR